MKPNKRKGQDYTAQLRISPGSIRGMSEEQIDTYIHRSLVDLRRYLNKTATDEGFTIKADTLKLAQYQTENGFVLRLDAHAINTKWAMKITARREDREDARAQ